MFYYILYFKITLNTKYPRKKIKLILNSFKPLLPII